MVIIPKSLWNGSATDLQAELDEFERAVLEHAQTVGVPAPMHQQQWIEDLYRSGQEWQLEPDPIPERRAWAVRTRGVGEFVVARETTEHAALLEGEIRVFEDPAGKILDADGETIRPETDSEALTRRKAARWQEMKGLRVQYLHRDLTCMYDGSEYQAREEDRNRLDGAMAKIEDERLKELLPREIVVPTTIPWRDNADVVHQLTADDCRVLSAMMFLAQQGVWLRSWELDAAIKAASTLEDLDEITW